jgi:hypothetical protein
VVRLYSLHAPAAPFQRADLHALKGRVTGGIQGELQPSMDFLQELQSRLGILHQAVQTVKKLGLHEMACTCMLAHL